MIIGHKTQWEFLRRIAKNNEIPQSFLFAGPDSLGKKRVALEFIKLLNCQEKNFFKRPCRKCFTCNLIEKGRHPDLILVQPKERRESQKGRLGEIQISQIRDLQRILTFRSQVSRFKSVIIDEAHTLNASAQNCLLKTLEDPPGRVIFFLITPFPEMLFETVRSRSEILKFYPLKDEEIRSYFKEKISDHQIQKIVEFSEGKPGWVINFLNSPRRLFEVQKGFKEIERILMADLSQRFRFVKDFFAKEKENFDLSLFLQNLERYLRKSFLEHLKLTSNLSDGKTLEIKKRIELVGKIKFLLTTTNLDPRLALETLMLML